MTAPTCPRCGDVREEPGLCPDCANEIMADDLAAWAAEDRLDDLRHDLEV